MDRLSPQLFAILSTLVEERVGLSYSADDGTVFSEKVGARMAEAGFESPLDYYYYLRYDAASGPEMDALVDALVVGETYFFRELDPLRVSLTHVLRPAIERRGRARIWSAGCATGEEPLTLAMLAADEGLLDRCEIVATDVSARSLSRAKKGIYGQRALRVVDDAPGALVARLARRFLTPLAVGDPAHAARVAREITDAVDFRRLNLLDDASVDALGRFDLVLCRNVLIYFRDDTVQRVVGRLCRALHADGRLVIGASESLLRFGTMLVCEERGGAFFYAKDKK